MHVQRCHLCDQQTLSHPSMCTLASNGRNRSSSLCATFSPLSFTRCISNPLRFPPAVPIFILCLLLQWCILLDRALAVAAAAIVRSSLLAGVAPFSLAVVVRAILPLPRLLNFNSFRLEEVRLREELDSCEKTRESLREALVSPLLLVERIRRGTHVQIQTAHHKDMSLSHMSCVLGSQSTSMQVKSPGSAEERPPFERHVVSHTFLTSLSVCFCLCVCVSLCVCVCVCACMLVCVYTCVYGIRTEIVTLVFARAHSLSGACVGQGSVGRLLSPPVI